MNPKLDIFNEFFSKEVWEKINVLSCGFSFIHKHLFFEENQYKMTVFFQKNLERLFCNLINFLQSASI